MKYLSIFPILLGSLLLTQCGHIHSTEVNASVQDISLQEELETEMSEREIALYEGIYQHILTAQKHEKRNKDKAIAIYLDAAETVWRSKNTHLIPLYNHAVGQAADLLQQTGVSSAKNYATAGQAFTVSFDSVSENTKPIQSFDDLIPVDCLERKGLRSEVSRAGVGAPMVVLHGTTGVKENPFISPVGGDYSVTAFVDFSQKGKAVFRFYDVTKVHSLKLWGKDVPLAANFSAGYYISSKRKSEGGAASRIMGVFRPMRYSGRMGLYLEPQFDPNKIPLILVHGLVSSPMTWMDPMNELMADESLLENYQIYTYYYPTGFPLRMTGAKLKSDLLRLQEYGRSHGAGAKVDKMVVFGHSMGGLLTSLQIRELGEGTWSELSDLSIEEMRMSSLMREDFQVLFEKDQPKGIKRVVFIATPHRGSNKANTWYGGFVATLIKIPQGVAQLDLVKVTESLTDLGKSVFNQDSPMNGMLTLRTGNPALKLVSDRPIAPRVTYHSIIGDQGKGDTPNSSDGIVPYSSSHLNGAESELIVPSGHSAHRDPAAIKEMRRILIEHLNKNS